MSSLADRIRAIVAPRVAGAVPGGGPGDLAQGVSAASTAGLKASAASTIVNLGATLGGEWRGGVFVVDRRRDPAALHGRERIGALADRLDRAAGEAPLFTGGSPARPPFVFFDLETTGLSGGAGTLAFLVGCAWFDADGAFVTRQFLLARHADERPLLEAVAAELARAGALVSFNGKSFDAPLLEGRYLFHRLAWRGRELPHVDVLHPARRFWKSRESSSKGLRYASSGERGRGDAGLGNGGDLFVARPATGESVMVAQPFRAASGEGCSLQALERQLIGLRRVGDVAGFEIPARYFQFIRSGDAAPLEAILEHNRLDLLTLAALTARLLHMTRSGPGAITDPREAAALGHVYARGGLDARARESYRRAIERCRSPRGAYDPIRIDALRALALTCRRARQHDEAAGCWRELAEMRGCPAPIQREAAEALAIHHEHRVKDLASAKRFTLGGLATLTDGPQPSLAEAMRHRLARIERKINGSAHNGQLLD